MSKIVSPGGSLVVSSGTLQTALDGTLDSGDIFVGGTASPATVNFVGDATIGFANPTVDYLSMITDLVPGQATAGAAVINAVGDFVNEGTIASNGPAGSVLTVNVLPSSATSPGYFFNPGLMMADPGDTLIINVGSNAALYDTGSIVADGGFVQVNFAPGAVFGGDAPTRSFNIIEAGGTLETGSYFPSYVGTNGTHGEYEFEDSTTGNTLKIDNLAGFGGVVLHFAAGDKIDLGTSLQVGTLTYNAVTGLLALESANGTVLDTLNIGNDGTGIASGTFAVAGGSADGFNLGTGADGNTVLTTNMGLVKSSGASGSWQSASVWAAGVPGTSSVADIGLGAVSPFTLTTAGAPVTVGGISLDSAAPTVTIASNVTLTSGGNDGQISIFGGTVSVTSGSTITGGAVQLYTPGSSFTLAAGATADLAGRLNVNAGPTLGVWSLQAGGNPYAFSVGAGYAEIDGTLIAGPTATTRGGSVSIGYNSGGQSSVLVVNAGAVVTTTHTTMNSDPTSSGTLIVNGSGASYTDVIDPADTAYTRGNITIGYNDIGSNIAVGLTQPGPIAAAVVIIENGATMTEQGSGASIGNSYDSAGSVTVESGGFWNLAYNGVGGGLGVGRQGSGSLTILSGGSVAIGANETILSNGTTAIQGGMGVGQVAGGTGTVLVSGAGSQLSTLNGFSVGGGGQGMFSIVNGGTVLVKAGGVSVATTAGSASSGTIVVGGAGSLAALSFAAGSGGLTIGQASRGTLIVGDAGSVNVNGSGYVIVGSNAGSSGTIVIGGTTAPAVINIGTAGLTVGSSGAGVVAVNSLGTLAVTGTLGTSILVGGNSGASGVLTVNGGLVTEGASSTGMIVGLNGNGTAVVQSGGSLVLAGGGLSVGNNSGANGSVTVTGAGSAFRSTGGAATSIGLSGNGSLAIVNGGSVGLGGALAIGLNSNGNGSVTLSGSSDRLNVAGAATVGSSGNGLLAIGTGNSVAVGGALIIGANANSFGTVTLSGSDTLTVAGGIEVGAAGTGTLTMQGGTASAGFLSLGGSNTNPLGYNTDRASLSGGADMAVNGVIAVWGGSTLSVDSASAIDAGTSGTYIGGAINLESGHTLTGSGVVAAAVVNNGLIQSSGLSASNAYTQGTLDIRGAVSGAGSLSIGNNSVLEVDGTLAAGEPIQFGSNAELILNTPGTVVANAISGLSNGDKIDLNLGAATVVTNVQYLSGQVTIFTNLGSYVLSNVNFAAGTSSTFDWGLDQSSGDEQIQVVPNTLNWTGAAGDTVFGDAGNWSPGAVPNANLLLNFYNNPGTVTGSGTALDLNFGQWGVANNQNWTLNNTTINVAGFPNPPWLPNTLGFQANVVVIGGSLNAASGVSNIGNYGGVAVTAQGGARVTTLGDSVGTATGQSGSLVLTGAGTTWTEQSQGTINGNGTGWLNVGGNGPGNGAGGSAGFLTVTNSALLNTQGVASIGGYGSGAYGAATVSNGGTWTIGNGLQIGPSGIGVLTLSGGAINVTGYATIGQNIGSSGTLNVNGGVLTTTGQLTLAQSTGEFGGAWIYGGTVVAGGGFQDGSGGTGQITVGSGGTLLFGGTYNPIGAYGNATGILSIGAGGTVAATQAAGNFQVLQIGAASGTAGTVTVSGAGALLNLNGNGFSVGSAGNGSLAISNGATVNASVTSAGAGVLSAAGQTGSEASITIAGAGSALNLAGNVTIGQLGSGNLSVTGGVLNIQNVAGSGGLYIGAGYSSATSSGGLAEATVSNGGTINNANSLVLGGNGASGVLNVGNGGLVLLGSGEVGGNALRVGIASGNNGTIYGGTGLLNISAGGTVAVAEAPNTTNAAVVIGADNSSAGQQTGNAEGDVVVSGAGALLNTNGGPLEIGSNSIGNLTISQGGTVLTGTPNSNNYLGLYVGRYSVGSILLTDSGSNLTDTGSVSIGRAGSGSLLIQNHATMIVNNDTTGVGGIGIGSAQGNANTVQTSVQTGGAGVAQVTSGGELYSQSTVNIAKGDESGQLSVNTGGTVEAGTTVNIGLTETLASGGSIVSATGTAIIAGGSLLAGRGILDVGAGGLLKADGAGITTAGSADITIGAGQGVSAAMNVTGAGAVVNSNGYEIAVGAAGSGEMTISQGGTVLAGTPFANDEAIYAGNTAGATGAITVTDAGSKLLATGQLSVGMAGAGSLLIQNQGSIFSGGNTADASQGFELGQFATGAGQATVTGPQSLLFNNGRFIVGDAGYGNLAILNGGTVTTTGGLGATIGAQSGGSGLIDVEDSGSGLRVVGTLQIGGAGSGELIIGSGATAFASGGFSVGTSGILLQTGGAVGGTGTGRNAGVMGGIGTLNGGIENDGTIYAQGGTYTVSGAITTGAGLAGELLIDGGLYLVTSSATGTTPGTGIPPVTVGTPMGGDLVLNGPVAAGQTVVFSGSGGTLTIGDLSGFTPTQINGFTAGDEIVITGVTLTGENFNATNDQLVLTDTLGHHDTLQFTGSLTAAELSAAIIANTAPGFGVTESGLAYTWDTHAVLSGVTVAAIGSGDPSGPQALPMELRNVQFNNGTITAQLWANAGTGAGNFDAAFGLANGVTGAFTAASTLPSGWSVLSNPSAGGLTIGGISLTNITGWSQLGSVSFVLPAGTTQTQIALTSGDIGSTNATPFGLTWSSATSGSGGNFAIGGLTPDTYSLTATRTTADLGSAITSADALAALKIAVGIDPNPTINGVQAPVSPYQLIAADINADGKVNAADALNILKMAVGLSSAPAASWVFLPETQTFWNAGTYSVSQSNVPTTFPIGGSVLTNSSVDLVGVLKGDINGSWNAPAGSSVLPLGYFASLSRSTGAPLATWGIETLTVAQALAAYSANPAMPTAVIADTAANVAGSIDGLEGMVGHISGIVLTDAGTPTLTISQTQDANDYPVLSTILTPYNLSIQAGPSTWSWNGSGWTLVSGPGNASGNPNNGDTAIINGGTVAPGVDTNLIGNVVELGGTAGASGVLSVAGDTGTNYNSPTFDNGTTLTNTVPGLTSAGSSVLNANGITVNQGTIEANGPAGSVFTINIGTAVPGTLTIPGYFYNPGEIDAYAGNTLIINVGTASELFNTGQIMVNGGTAVIKVAAGAISGGEATVRGIALIEGGGTLETALSIPASSGSNGTRNFDIFADSTPGNTLRIDNLGSFADTIQGFAAGDTIDLGSSLAVGSLVFNAATNLFVLENAAGATLASLLMNNWTGQLQSGTFAVAGGSADGINISLAADGDTILTTNATNTLSTNVSGAWQSGSVWNGGTIPSATASPLIGVNASAPLTITTGATPVSAGGLELVKRTSTVQITSNTTLTNQIQDFSGSIDVSSGSTLTAGAIQMTGDSANLTVETGAVLAINGRLNTNLAPVNGVWGIAAGGNVFALVESAGTVAVNGSLLAGPAGGNRGGSITIGYQSSGTPALMTVNSGTVVAIRTVLGSDATSSGTLIVSGAGASWTDVIDTGDTAFSRGNIVIGNNDTSLNTPAGLLPPAPMAPAQLTIQNGAVMTEQQGATVGATPNSVGSVTVQSGGFWNLANNGIGFLSVGNGGVGVVSVINGGSIAVGNNGTFLNNGTTQISGGIGLGQNAGNTGTIVVSGAGSQLSSLNGMAVGKAGQGLLSVTNGAIVQFNGGGVSVGSVVNAASSGTIAVGGSGAAAVLNMGTGTANLTIGSASKGTLTVADGGSIVMTGTGYLTAGSAAGSFGTIIVAGNSAAATVSIGIGGLTAGLNGTGSVLISNLGTIGLHGTNAVTVGQNSGASGTLTVQNGGILSDPVSMTVGMNAGSTGGVSVANGGTIIASAVSVGSAGTASVSVAAGGVFTDTGALNVGLAATGLGTIAVAGAGANMTVLGSTAIGVSGTASVTVQSGGVANFNGGLSIGSAGSLLDSGGTVTVSGSIQPSVTIAVQSGGSLNLAAATSTSAVTIQTGADAASVSAGLGSPSLSFIGTPDAVSLGAGPAVVDFALQPASGLETIANFAFGVDQLNIDLAGAANSVLTAANTTVNGVAAISVYSSADPTHGVILTSPGGGVTAATLLSGHTTFSGGHALIS